MSAVLCFYHSPCNDGATAAAALALRIGKIDPEKRIECYPMGFTMNWDDPLDKAFLKSLDHSNEEVTEIYIVDISISPVKHKQILDQLREKGRIKEDPRTICIDHHRTALDNIDVINSYCDETMIEIGPGLSGATLVWKYFNQKTGESLPVPPLLQYIADQDVWEWKLENSREINSALNTLNGKADTMVEELAWSLKDEDDWLQSRLSQGKAITSLIDSQLQKSYSRLFDYVAEDGTEYRVVNATDNASELGNMLCEESHHTPNVIAMIYTIQRDWSVKCSIRSIAGGTVMAREVAEQFGGGGHDHAAGCRFKDMMDFDKALETVLGTDVKLIDLPAQVG